LESAPYSKPYVNYLANFLSITIPIPSGWTPMSNNGRALQVEKKHHRVSGCSVPDVV